MKLGFFALIADETHDISRHEQDAVVLRSDDRPRYPWIIHRILSNWQNRQWIFGPSFKECTDKFWSWYLQLESTMLRWCGKYARNLPWCTHSLAMYDHCHLHILNLCIVDVCCTNTAVRHYWPMFSQSITSSKGQQNDMLFLSDFSATFTTLKSLSDTRWSCRAEPLRAILDNFETIVDTLSEISENYVSVGRQAGSLLTSDQFSLFLPLHFEETNSHTVQCTVQSATVIHLPLCQSKKHTIFHNFCSFSNVQ